MHGRVVAGAVLVIALVAAILSLRGQVEPTVATPTEPPPPTATTPAEPTELPVRTALRETHWRVYDVPPGTSLARADPEHVVISVPDDPQGASLIGTLIVRSRDGSGLETSYRPQPPGWGPAAWQILGGELFVVEVLVVDGNGLGSRLMRVNLATGRAEQIPVHIVQRLAPYVLSVGDELISAGISTKNPIENCVVAIRPSTGEERIVACGLVEPMIGSADGGALIRLPDNSPDGCSVRLLLPGRGAFGIPVFVGYCDQSQIIPVGTWHVYHIRGRFAARPLLATEGTRRLMLGTLKVAAVSCHGRLYWVSGGPRSSQYGVEVLRWTPGAEEVEVVFRSRDSTQLGLPMCADGTVTVPVVGPQADGSVLVGVRVLDRP